MLGAYASFAVIFLAAALVGQAIVVACGRAEVSRLAPAIGLAALCPLAWWTVRLPGEGVAALVALALAAAISGFYLRGRFTGWRSEVARDLPLALAALALASLPFLVEGRFGILGTGLNPDMSQHLFAADRLAAAGSERLIAEGYPLGPHSIAVAVAELGPGLVAAFNGLIAAVAVAACLVPLALADRLGRGWRPAVALCVGFAYLVAAYYVQGAFKETLQALFVLAFAVGLAELARVPAPGARRPASLLAVPLAVLAVGTVYVYSFPGLAWLMGTLAVWGAVELGRLALGDSLAAAGAALRAALPALLGAGLAFALAIAPELTRMAEFASFETFDPDGAGLGNLFDRLSPLEALGIWPSGDFRVEPGDGFAPALLFYVGAAAAGAALVYGLVRSMRHGRRALPAALAAALALWLYALVAGTPYQEAKALVLAAPLVAVVWMRAVAFAAAPVLAAALLAAAGGSSLLALANGPVGPAAYSPELAELRTELGGGLRVVVSAPAELLDEQHGLDYLLWELRGNRVCVEEQGSASTAGPGGLEVGLDDDGAVVPLGAVEPGAPGTDCPLIPDAARADPSAGP